jgi:hypothetical protein
MGCTWEVEDARVASGQPRSSHGPVKRRRGQAAQPTRGHAKIGRGNELQPQKSVQTCRRKQYRLYYVHIQYSMTFGLSLAISSVIINVLVAVAHAN